MSRLVQAKTAAFNAKLKERSTPEFQERQAEHERQTAESNAGLTALLAAHKAAGTAPSPQELEKYPTPCESPLEALSREIYAGIAGNG